MDHTLAIRQSDGKSFKVVSRTATRHDVLAEDGERDTIKFLTVVKATEIYVSNFGEKYEVV